MVVVIVGEVNEESEVLVILSVTDVKVDVTKLVVDVAVVVHTGWGSSGSKHHSMSMRALCMQ